MTTALLATGDAIVAKDTKIRGQIRPASFYLVSLPLLAVATITGVVVGSTPLEWTTVVRVIAIKVLPAWWANVAAVSAADVAIVWLIRLPRVLVAAAVGAGLATAGAMMQSLFRNQLAEPTLTGVGPGAVLGAVVVFVTGWGTA